MALIVDTASPSALLDKIRNAIDKKEIETWEYDKDGDFSHTPPQWKFKAWLRPHVTGGQLTFGLLGPKETSMDKATYGVYHGRFAEMLLTHFDLAFTEVKATAQKALNVDNFT